MEEAIIAAGFAAIRAIIAQVEESKMADAEKKAAILARLNASQAALDVARTAEENELDKIKKS